MGIEHTDAARSQQLNLEQQQRTEQKQQETVKKKSLECLTSSLKKGDGGPELNVEEAAEKLRILERTEQVKSVQESLRTVREALMIHTPSRLDHPHHLQKWLDQVLAYTGKENPFSAQLLKVEKKSNVAMNSSLKKEGATHENQQDSASKKSFRRKKSGFLSWLFK